MADKKDYRSGHRERLRQRYLSDKLTDYEKFELLLTYAIPRVDVKPIAKELLRRFRGIREVFTAPIDKLTEIPGIGISSATAIKLVQDFMLMSYRDHMTSDPVFHDKDVLENYCKTLLGNKLEEEFHVLYLDKSFRLIRDYMHSRGTIDWSAVYPREIVRHAYDCGAMVAIFVHNHPSGSSSFSDDDVAVTKDMVKILDTMELKLHDHLLVANGVVYSAKNSFII